MKKIWMILGVVALALLAVGWYLFRPELLFINRSVNEALPGREATKLLRSGSFRSLAHETAGTAGIYEIAGGKRMLRLTSFTTSNGPDVRVYLVAGGNGADDRVVKGGGFIDLGAMKGNRGDQNYDLPGDVDLGKYQSVSIWCRRFGVNFGAASLK